MKERVLMVEKDGYQKALDRIFMISEKLILFEGLDDVFEHIVNTSIMLTLADAATIRVFNMETGTLDIVKGRGVSASFLTQPPIRLGEGITGRVVLEGRPFSTLDVSSSPECVHKELAALEGIKALICVPLRTRSGSIGCITVYKKRAIPFADYDLAVLGIFASQAVEAFEKTKLIKELQKQATHDQLTGIYNKNALIRQFEAEINLAVRHNHSTSVIFLDIDNFKVFNDTHGHLLGDKFLSDFSRILMRNCRKSDVVARFGGEEFVIIASHTEKDRALVLCSKLSRAVKKHRFAGSANEKVRVTFSAGISSFPEDGAGVAELLEKADEAMYKSKLAGRDTATLWSAPPGPQAGQAA